MSRSIRNEVLVAIGAFLFVIFVFLVAGLLSDRITDEVEMTQTGIARFFTETPTITSTPTRIPSRTHTPAQTRQATQAQTSIQSPTATRTFVLTAFRPSPTPLSQASNTPEPTPYRPRPTFTPFGTPVNANMITPIMTLSTPTNAVPSTGVLTASVEILMTASQVADPSTGSLLTLPATPTVMPFNHPSRTPSNCARPRGWAEYIVQEGNTLYAIALATGSTVDELRTVNCIENVDLIQTGDRLFVPRLPEKPVVTMAPRGMRPGLEAIGCFDGLTTITSPIVGQRLARSFIIFGSAHRSDFAYYKIEVRPDFSEVYHFYLASRDSVQSGTLGEFNPAIFGTGLHWLRLSVIDSDTRIPPDGVCEIPVVFE